MKGIEIFVTINDPRTGSGRSQVRNITTAEGGKITVEMIAIEALHAARAAALHFLEQRPELGGAEPFDPDRRPFDASKTHKLIDCRDLIELRRLARAVMETEVANLPPEAGEMLLPLLRKIGEL